MKKNTHKFLKIAVFTCVQVLLFGMTANATGADIVKNGFSVLTEIVKAVISSIGMLVVLWGIFEWGIALQSQDGTQQSMAFKRIGGGLVMLLAPQLIGLFVG